MPFLCCRAENLQCCVEFGQSRAKRCGDRIALRPVVTLIAGFVFLCVPVLIGSIVQYPKIKSQIDADDEANVAPIRESEAFTAALGSRLPGQFLYKNYDLVIVYELKNQGIFRVSQLMEVAKFERRLRALPEWSNLCLQVGAEFQSLCKDGLSLTNFVMATRQSDGGQSQIVPTALQFDGQGIEELPFTTINTILERYNLTGVLMPQVSLGESVSADALTGFRSIFRFRRIVKKVNDTQLMQVEARDRMNQEWTEFLEDALFPFLSEPQPSDTDFDDWPVHVWFTADTLDLELEVEREVVMDVRLAVGGAMSIVFVYMLLHTKSVFASLAGVLLLAFGPLVGYCVYAITAGTRSVSVVTVAILFPAVGLGVQTLLLYFHSWQESMENTGSYRECMNLTWKGAFSATFWGAAIGASAFFGILPSGSYDMRQMCGYLFPMILLQWATITIFYVPVLALDERYMKGFRLRRCCGSRISFGHSAARRILGNKWTDVIGQWWRFVFAAIALLTVLLLALSMAYIKVENTVPQSFPVQHNQVQGRRAMARFAAPSAVLDAKFSPPPVSENVCSEETSSFDEPMSTSGSSGSGDPTSTSGSSETCGLMWCTAVAKAADDTSCTCYRQALERTYEFKAGMHCGGNDIASWAGGGDSDLGRTDKTVAECKEICDSHSSECAGFTWDRTEGSCWWKTIAMDPYDDSEYDCYRVEGFYDYCIEGDLTTTTTTTSTTTTTTTSTTTNTTNTATTSTTNTTTSTTSTTTSTNSTTATTTTTTNTTSTTTTNGTATTTATTTKTTKTTTTTTATVTTVTITTITTTIGTTTTTTTTQLLKAIQRFVGFSSAHLELGGVLDTAADGSWQMPFKSNQPLVQKPVLTAAPPLVLQEWESGNINLQPAVDAHSLFIGGPGMCSWRELCYCSTYKCTAPEGAAWGWSSPVTPSEAVLTARDGTPNSSATPTSGVSLSGVRPTSIYVIVGLNANYNTDGTGNTQLDALWTFADGYDPGVLWAQRHQHSLCADVPEAIISTFGIAKKTCWIESFKKWVIRERDGRYPVPKTNFHTLLMQFLEQDNTTLSNTMWIRDGELKAWYAEFEVDIPLNVTELELSLYRQQWENYIETWRATSAKTAQGSGKSAWVTSAIWMGVQEPPTNLSGLGITVGLVCTAAILMLACSIPRPGKLLLIGCAVVGLLPTIFGVLFIQAVILNEPLGFIETTAFIAIMGHAASYSYHVILCYHTGEDKHPQCNMGSAAAAALGSAVVTAGCSFFLAVGFLPVFRNIGALTFLGVPFAAVVSLTFLPATIELFIEVSGQGQEEYVAGAAGPGTPRNGVPESCVHIASTGSASDGLISQRSQGDVRDSRGGSASTVPSQMSEFTLDDGMGWVETRDSGDTGAGLGPTHNVS